MITNLAEFFLHLVQILDRWVIVLSFLSMLYLIVNFKRFYRKYIVGSYILVLLLFTFWGVRSVFAQDPFTSGLPFLMLSFLLDIVVVIFAASIIYHYERLGDVAYVRKLFGLQHVDEIEVVEYEGPQIEDVEPGKYYLVLERGFSYEWKLFESLSEELPALCFTRKLPHKIDMDISKRNISFYWLSESDVKSVERQNVTLIEPFRRGEMKEIIANFIQDNRNPVILIDGLEYLIYKNSPQAIIEFIQELQDSLANRFDATIIFSVDREGISSETFSLIKEEMDEVRKVNEDSSVEEFRF